MDLLRSHGYEPLPVELDEFMKAGGSAKCLTLALPTPSRPYVPTRPEPVSAQS